MQVKEINKKMKNQTNSTILIKKIFFINITTDNIFANKIFLLILPCRCRG